MARGVKLGAGGLEVRLPRATVDGEAASPDAEGPLRYNSLEVAAAAGLREGSGSTDRVRRYEDSGLEQPVRRKTSGRARSQRVQ